MIEAMRVLANLLEGGLEGFLAGVPGPNPNAVTRATTPREYLDEKKIPQWYQRLLFRFERVTVEPMSPNGELGLDEPVWEINMRIPAGSLVYVDHAHGYTESDTHSDDEFNRVFEEARDDARDHVFDSHRPDPDNPDSRDNFLELVRDFQGALGSYLFGGRDDPITLQEFIRRVREDDFRERAPRHLIIGAHFWASELGFAPSTSDTDKDLNFTYEDVGRFTNELKLDYELLQPRSKQNGTPLLIFTGCGLGQAEPFLRKLRDAINPRLTAVAPLHFYGVTKMPNGSFFEYMAMPYTVYSKSVLTKEELISRLQKPKRHDFHNVEIEDHEWKDWVPEEPWRVGVFNRQGATLLAHTKVEKPMFGVPVSVDREAFFRNPHDHFKSGIASLSSEPTHPLSSAHPFPIWQRYGLANAKELVDKFAWQFTFNETGEENMVESRLGGHRYVLIVPIVQRSPQPYGHTGYQPYGDRLPIWNVYGFKSGVLNRNPRPEQLPYRDGKSNQFWKVIEPSA